jgi:general secretion pathway protein K
LDANEAQKFLLAIGMMKSFLPGLPVFSSANDFVSALQQASAGATPPGQTAPAAPAPSASPLGGGSPVAMIMKALGLQPIPILSPDQTKGEITTESKVFSIYATGYVHSGKRESTSRIHAVVDFRGAPAPMAFAQLNGSGGPLPPGTPPPATSATPPGTTPPGAPPGTVTGIPGVLKPGAGGNVIYYRVD